jgi:hypothetical protein
MHLISSLQQLLEMQTCGCGRLEKPRGLVHSCSLSKKSIYVPFDKGVPFYFLQVYGCVLPAVTPDFLSWFCPSV